MVIVRKLRNTIPRREHFLLSPKTSSFRDDENASISHYPFPAAMMLSWEAKGAMFAGERMGSLQLGRKFKCRKSIQQLSASVQIPFRMAVLNPSVALILPCYQGSVVKFNAVLLLVSMDGV